VDDYFDMANLIMNPKGPAADFGYFGYDLKNGEVPIPTPNLLGFILSPLRRPSVIGFYLLFKFDLI